MFINNTVKLRMPVVVVSLQAFFMEQLLFNLERWIASIVCTKAEIAWLHH